MKKPWLAGLLNVIPGAGYLYVDWKRPFGWWLMAATVCVAATFFSPITAETIAASENTEMTVWDSLGSLGGLLFLVAFIVDANMEARKRNSKPSKR